MNRIIFWFLNQTTIFLIIPAWVNFQIYVMNFSKSNIQTLLFLNWFGWRLKICVFGSKNIWLLNNNKTDRLSRFEYENTELTPESADLIDCHPATWIYYFPHNGFGLYFQEEGIDYWSCACWVIGSSHAFCTFWEDLYWCCHFWCLHVKDLGI